MVADIVLLSFKSSNTFCFIETSNLDGERNLKPKIPVFDKAVNLEEKFKLLDQSAYL